MGGTAAKDKAARRLFFFYESGATGPGGTSIAVIVVEVGDARHDFYGQRIYSAEERPAQLTEEVSRLGDSPFAGLLIRG